jgi:DNA adenine methylase
MTLFPVMPAEPIAPYVGGKSRLAKTIISQIDTIPHNAYCEAFVGMGGVFLRRHTRPKTEVINDYNGEVANLFRILNHHYQPFVDMLKWQLASRSEYNRLIDTDPALLTDLQRAARFLYLQRLAFGGKISGKNFGITPNGSARFNMQKLVPMLYKVHKRLYTVVIENLDYKDFIKRYDRAGTLFYLDPPYYGNENDYGKGLFARSEFPLMAELLGGIRGKFILSLNDRSEVRELFKDFFQYEVATLYSLSKDRTRNFAELLISNVELSGLVPSKIHSS